MSYPKDYDAASDPNHVDRITIGSIQFPEAIDEVEVGRVGFRKGVGMCKIEVYSDEGAIPHFHISSINGSFHSCVCIYSNNYFSHGGKYTDTFNGSQRIALNEWLMSTNDITLVSNWTSIVNLWEMSNRNCLFPANKKVKDQPDYSSMTQFRKA